MNPHEETTRNSSQADPALDFSKPTELEAWEAAFGKNDRADQRADEVGKDEPTGSGRGTTTDAVASDDAVSVGENPKRRGSKTPKEGWPPLPRRLEAAGPGQQEYPPIPGFTGQLVDSTVRLSGCSRPVAALGAIGALSALCAWDWDVKTLAPEPKPLSLNVLASSETTWRKSTAWRPLWRPHLDADMELEAAWQEAKAHFEAASADDEPRAGRPRANNPQMTRGEITMEALKVRLATGRPCQALFSDEAAELLKWSYQGNRLGSTLGFLSKAFDGTELYDDKLVISREISVRRYRFQVVLAGQSMVIIPLITNPAAANGFSGRSLVAKDDQRPRRLEAPTDSDQEVLKQYSEMVMTHRKRQDEGSELKATIWPDPQILRLDPDAQQCLLQFHEEMETQADGFYREGRVHEQGFAGRAAELAARLSAVFSGVDWYVTNPGRRPGTEDGHPGFEQVRAACEVVSFHLHELGRILAIAGDTELGAAVNKVTEWITEALLENLDGGASRHVNKSGHVALVRLINDRVRTGPLRDPEFRSRVVRILENEFVVSPVMGRRGWHWPHPDL